MNKTIVILETAGPEYRVRLLDNPELLYRGINANTSKWIPNSPYIHSEFDAHNHFSIKEMAISRARVISNQPENADLEGGIQIIDIWSDTSYTDL